MSTFAIVPHCTVLLSVVLPGVLGGHWEQNARDHIKNACKDHYDFCSNAARLEEQYRILGETRRHDKHWEEQCLELVNQVDEIEKLGIAFRDYSKAKTESGGMRSRRFMIPGDGTASEYHENVLLPIECIGVDASAFNKNSDDQGDHVVPISKDVNIKSDSFIARMKSQFDNKE